MIRSPYFTIGSSLYTFSRLHLWDNTGYNVVFNNQKNVEVSKGGQVYEGMTMGRVELNPQNF